MKVTLEIVSNGEAQTRELKPGSFLRIGRNEKSQWIIQDDKLSGAHCEINLRFNRLVITDLNSKNGTYVNGIRVEQADLFAGDKLRIGETMFTIQQDLMDETAIKILADFGDEKERAAKKVRLDFTSARLKNRALFNGGSLEVQSKKQKELKISQKPKCQRKISKEEVKSIHSFEAQMSTIIDCLALFAIIYFPMLLTKIIPFGQKTFVFIFLEILLVSLFLILNFGLSRFTFGEQVAGIKDLCQSKKLISLASR
jgi:hypothetical protein